MNFWKFVGLLLIVAGISAVVMALWNWLMPAIFGLGVISFWQALGIFLLSKLLFGRLRLEHENHGEMKQEKLSKNPIHDKWMIMTPEQREKFIQKRKEHFVRDGFFEGRNFDFDADENKSKHHE